MRMIIVGNTESVFGFIENYIKENKFLDYEIDKFEDVIKIEDVRNIKKSLSFKVKTKKLFIFLGELTVEAQNSLLKFVEEPQENVSFIFCAKNINDYLPTVRSRCKTVMLGQEEKVDNKIKMILDEIGSDQKKAYDLSEKLTFHIEDKSLDIVLKALRQILLESLDSEKNKIFYSYCKKAVTLFPLANTNNVNKRIVFEMVFAASKV